MPEVVHGEEKTHISAVYSKPLLHKDTIEVDFVIYRHRKVIELIQVALSLDDQKTRKREIKALLAADEALNALKLTIITLNQKEEIAEGEKVIRAVPVVEWLLEIPGR